MTLTAMELERQARIEANRLRMQQIGLAETVAQIAAGQQQERQQRRSQHAASTAARRAARVLPAGRPRRSERVAGLDAPDYNENGRLLALADGGVGGARDRRTLRENQCEEVYDVEHLDALGSYDQEWELFVDGYDAAGNRVYDKVNGQTCHQCRQKTLGKRTCCSSCNSLQGVLCGDCLFMRYGENVDEANANPDWVCPLCRDICNCSFHRSKRGWAPTGTLYRHAIAEGYKSVAHFLVLNNLSDEAKPVALQRDMCPPELAAELRKELAEEEEAARKQQQGAPAAGSAVPAAAAAVADQLLQLEPAQEEAVAAAAAAKAAPRRRSARNSSGSNSVPAPAAAAGAKGQQKEAAQQQAAAAAEAQPAGARRGKRQATLQLTVQAGGSKKQKAAAAGTAKVATAAGKAEAVPAARTRRGLRAAAAH